MTGALGSFNGGKNRGKYRTSKARVVHLQVTLGLRQEDACAVGTKFLQRSDGRREDRRFKDPDNPAHIAEPEEGGTSRKKAGLASRKKAQCFG